MGDFDERIFQLDGGEAAIEIYLMNSICRVQLKNLKNEVLFLDITDVSLLENISKFLLVVITKMKQLEWKSDYTVYPWVEYRGDRSNPIEVTPLYTPEYLPLSGS